MQVIAYVTEAGFWVGSVPFALGAAYVATGEIPDWTTEEGKTALGGYAFVLINFARLIVPARIALALAFAPWVDENIVKRFNPPDLSDLPEDSGQAGGRQFYFTRNHTSNKAAPRRAALPFSFEGALVLDRRRDGLEVGSFGVTEVRGHDDASDLILLGALEACSSGHHGLRAEPRICRRRRGHRRRRGARRVELHAVQV